ncbi:hypothetical protein K8B33_03220 [Alcanivorax sp. JB21]|uniref:hypothetical protein n=1 Tax=Alcanivorax limicola TaxID=2874102 RepID=UPI001CBB70A7|nr:hypothetical protein [Alcanivorax limicola]MBZ2188093.1 hypothetical protein [Alcanivorax limicola]
MDWIMMLATALLAALMTLIALALWLKFVVSPNVARDLEVLLKDQAEQAADLMAVKVEEAVRRGIVDGVTSLPTREVLQGTTRNIARTSVEIVEERLGSLFGRKKK